MVVVMGVGGWEVCAVRVHTYVCMCVCVFASLLDCVQVCIFVQINCQNFHISECLFYFFV